MQLGPLRALTPLAFAALLAACGGSAAQVSSASSAASAASTSTAKPGAAPVTSLAAGPVSAPAKPASGAAAASPVGSAGPGTASSPGGKVTVKLATPARPDQAALYLSMARGYWDKQGINIEIAQIDSGAQMVPALSTNQIQVGSGSPSASLFNALNRDINIRLVADFAHVGAADDKTLAMMVRTDSTAKVMADLKGKTVVNGVTKGSIADILFAKAVQKEGLKATDFDVQYLTFPDTLTALGSKKIEAGQLTEPLVTQAIGQKIANVLVPAGAVIPGAELSVLQYSPQFAAQQPDVAVRFMVGFLQGARDYHDAFFENKGQDLAISQLTQSLPVKDPQVWKTSYPATVDQNGKVNVDDLKAQAQFYQQQGTLQGDIPDITKFIDTKFAEDAVKQLGAR